MSTAEQLCLKKTKLFLFTVNINITHDALLRTIPAYQLISNQVIGATGTLIS